MIGFRSDNSSPAHPAVLQAVCDSNEGAELSYGDDRWSARLNETFSELFGTEAWVVPAVTGTAANALSLAALAGPTDAAYVHEESHISHDECNAPEFFTGGTKIVTLGGGGAKFDAARLEKASDVKADVHRAAPRVVSVTQATELGTLYTLEELRSIAEVARRRKMRLHMDGARFANAVAALGCEPAEMTWKLGFDAVSFGGTKNGCLMAEAVVLFDRSPLVELQRRAKRAGQLLSKMRFLSAQLLAYVRDGLWLDNARHANRMNRTLAERLRGLGIEPALEPEANMTFVPLGRAARDALKGAGFDTGRDGDAPVRLCASWCTREEDIDRLAALLRG